MVGCNSNPEPKPHSNNNKKNMYTSNKIYTSQNNYLNICSIGIIWNFYPAANNLNDC